ncbi:MAG TPA: SPOR domain-containing protein [Vicinamibacterales bacterium]|jgi:cell division protein FtsN
MADEGVHEIQLNGKQLVFMFMAVTVVAVVIFLCGVMVGRGVRTPRAAEAAETTSDAPVDPTAAAQPPSSTEATTSTTASAAGSGAPATTQEKLTYADRLSSSTSPPETLRSEPIAPAAAPADAPTAAKVPVADAKPASKAAAKPESKADAKAESKAESKSAAAESADTGNGFVVQVAAVKARSEADTIAKRLSSKGFPSYVTTPGPGAAHVYRVRVGKYTDRREAESVARRLEKEEQFKPWITR